jgi:peroxiredoxin 2/4
MIESKLPLNELIGSKVINPPPKDVFAAEVRMKKEKGYAWWFTYKDLN